MPVMVHVTDVEAEALNAVGFAGLRGNVMSYNPLAAGDILATLDKASDAYDRLQARLVAVALGLGDTSMFFRTPESPPLILPAPVVTGSSETWENIATVATTEAVNDVALSTAEHLDPADPDPLIEVDPNDSTAVIPVPDDTSQEAF